jgi:hypothetical protein
LIAHAYATAGAAGVGQVPSWALVAILLAVVGMIVAISRSVVRQQRARERAVEAAAARLGDPTFASENVRSSAEALFRAAWLAREARDNNRLAELMFPKVQDWFSQGMQRHHRHRAVRSIKELAYVSLVKGSTEIEDRVVVLIRAKVSDWVQLEGEKESTATSMLVQWWTLAKRDGQWAAWQIEAINAGTYHLKEPLPG